MNDGATVTPAKPVEEIDMCPRMVGFGKHAFCWKNFGHTDIVVCINCGQERRRTMKEDVVTVESKKSI